MAVLMSVFMGCGQPIYNAAVDGILYLKDGKKIMDAFIIPPVPIYMSFYLFNLSNAQDVLYYGAKPNVTEVGPYVYEEKREKFDLEFSDDGESVEYQQTKTYFWREDKNPGRSQTDVITTANVVMVLLAALGHNIPGIGLIWPEIENTMDVFETFTVSEVLFEGWDLPEFNFNFGLPRLHFNGTLYDILLEIGMPDEKIPDIVKGNKIGYYSFMNGTTDGVYEVSTGNPDISTYINILKWDNDTELSWWGDTYCDMINGTDGTQFPPRSISETTTVRIFVTELCRSLYLNYESDLDYFGVTAQRFVPPAEMLQSAVFNEANECFVDALGNLPSSMMEMTPCMGIPIIMSTPHFFQGEQNFSDNYIGINPVKELHETYLDVETTLGVPVRAHKRIQVNLPLMKYGHLTSFMNFDELLVYPVMWADESAILTESDTEALKKALTLPFTIIYSVGGVVLLAAFIMVVVGLKKRSQMRQTV